MVDEAVLPAFFVLPDRHLLPMYGEERYSRGRKGGLFMENSELENTENLDFSGSGG
jgi:hypothetical protein